MFFKFHVTKVRLTIFLCKKNGSLSHTYDKVNKIDDLKQSGCVGPLVLQKLLVSILLNLLAVKNELEQTAVAYLLRIKIEESVIISSV